MEGIIVLAVVWFVIAQIAKVAKQAKRREAQDDARREAQDVSRPARAPVETGGVQTSVWDQIAEMYEETARPRMHDRMGDSYSDGEGCIGGSIEHAQHEGSFAPGSLDYTPTVYASGSLDYKPTTEYNPVAFGETHVESRLGRVRLTAADMRGAVIMAEILGKPVALRHD